MRDRPLPHDSDAESLLLAAISLRASALDDVAGIVTAEDFFHDHHQRIFRHMQQLAVRSVPIDYVSLKDALTTAGELDAVGGPAALLRLGDGMPHGTHVESYARIVREKAILRAVICASGAALEAAYAASESATAVLDQAQQALMDIATHTVTAGFVPASSWARALFPALEALVQRRGPVTGVPTGLSDLDYLTAGFQPGDLVLVAARPSMGKTALALNAAFYAATTGRRQVAISSLEMSTQALGLRLVGSEAQIDGHRLRTGHIRDVEWPRITAALTRLADSGLHIDDGSQLTIPALRAKARKLKATSGLDLVMVDYLQLMEGQKSESRNLEMAGLSRALKMLAKDLHVPVVALSQLSRAPELRSEKRPQLSDLRDSGSLEQDADVVIFLYRDEVYTDAPEVKGLAELIVAKQRNGPIGTARVCFNANTTSFHDLYTPATPETPK